MMQHWRGWARRVKRETYALAIAYRDPRTPWYARIVVGIVVAYAFSPFDLIPDVIPIIGYLDDLILVPLGIMLAVRLIPPIVLGEARLEAERRDVAGKPVSRLGAAIIVGIWVLAAVVSLLLVRRIVR